MVSVSVVLFDFTYSKWPTDWTPTESTTPCQSGTGSNSNEEVFYILLSSRLEPHLQIVWCYTQDIRWQRLTICKDAIDVLFYSPSWQNVHLRRIGKMKLRVENFYSLFIVLIYGWKYCFIYKDISAMWDAISLIQDSNLCHQIHFLQW